MPKFKVLYKYILSYSRRFKSSVMLCCIVASASFGLFKVSWCYLQGQAVQTATRSFQTSGIIYPTTQQITPIDLNIQQYSCSVPQTSHSKATVVLR